MNKNCTVPTKKIDGSKKGKKKITTTKDQQKKYKKKLYKWKEKKQS